MKYLVPIFVTILLFGFSVYLESVIDGLGYVFALVTCFPNALFFAWYTQ